MNIIHLSTIIIDNSIEYLCIIFSLKFTTVIFKFILLFDWGSLIYGWYKNNIILAKLNFMSTINKLIIK